MRTLFVETSTHGRVLVRDAASGSPRGFLFAFHGYGQAADTILAELEKIPGIGGWTVVSVQALHRFYTRDERAIVASWMTRQDRELAIADNVEYVDRAVDAVVGPARASTPRAIVFAGFSQGVAMAYRAAVLGRHRAAGVIALGGDVPPDLALEGLPPVLIGAGDTDGWYTPARVQADVARLAAAQVSHEVVTFAGGHEWSDVFRRAAGEWLSRR
jgi:predicted esterase